MVALAKRLGADAGPDCVFEGEELFEPTYQPSSEALFGQESKVIRVLCEGPAADKSDSCWLLLVSNARPQYLPLASCVVCVTKAPGEGVAPVERVRRQLAEVHASFDWRRPLGVHNFFGPRCDPSFVVLHPKEHGAMPPGYAGRCVDASNGCCPCSVLDFVLVLPFDDALPQLCEHIRHVARTNFLGNGTDDESCTGAHLTLAARIGCVSASKNMPPAVKEATRESLWKQLLSRSFVPVRSAFDVKMADEDVHMRPAGTC